MKKKILIVDDEVSIVETLKTRLEQEGYEVLGASTGEKGFELAVKELPDAILLDIFLPGEDGLAVLRKLKRPIDPETGEASKTMKIPVIVLTGPGEKMEEIFRMEKAAAFFTKPFDSRVLISEIERSLREASR